MSEVAIVERFISSDDVRLACSGANSDYRNRNSLKLRSILNSNHSVSFSVNIKEGLTF
jgi:hypothetical protein